MVYILLHQNRSISDLKKLLDMTFLWYSTQEKTIITVHTYQLGDPVPSGEIRALHPYRTIRFKLEEFASRFIAGAHLPKGSELDGKIKAILACS